ncbi:TonB-dependent receptor [Qipengyuania gelatinilytica]|uniref:TonB-dependent siderophore receptor n=1 Tax=Qipengyuania gelatinilytica TaxID=2867231 RepID=A0ABX9A2Z7_9SPHN|nr:TonB-dependent siderophore receptor [Qipengyuania gelatinilytica]QZD94669.1 TonB-dependent siderophore receptor [Qipengyuania gelatinilytica]
MRSLATLAILLSGTALAAPAAASTLAADAQPERDYLPTDIVVTGERADGYDNEDGSTATKTPTPLIDVPQAVSFITEDQLEDQSIRQLNDALRYIPGVSMESGEGHRDEVFIRGQETTADFYIDGLRDDAQYYRSLYNIERVEVLKGANALIFGRGAGGGAINRVAKRADLSNAFVGGEASVDNFGAFALLADVNQPVTDDLALRLNATYEEFNNDRDFYDGRFIGISPTLTAALGPDTTLIASYTYDNDERVTDRGVPSLDGGPLTGYDSTFFGDRDFNYSEAEVHIGRVRLEHDFNGGLSANASLQFADYDKAYQNIVPGGTDGTTVSLGGYRDTTERTNWIGQANAIWEAESGDLESTFLFGVEASSQDTQNARQTVSFDTTNETALDDVIFVPAFSLNPTSRSRDSQLKTLSFYAQEQLQIGEYIELVGGLRWDRFDLETLDLIGGVAGDRVDEQFSPRAGLIVKPTPDLSIYASYAESFLPQAGDQFLVLSPDRSQFEPEKFTNYEIGAKWAPLDKVLVTAAIFRLERTNIRAVDPTDTTLTVLAGESRAEGFEIGAVGEVADFWKANLGYTYLDGELLNDNAFGTAGQRLQQLPEHSISAWNRFDLSEQLGFGLGVIHQSQQFASFSNDVVLPSYWRVDAAAYYTVSEKLSLQLNIENLLDEDYYPSAHGDNNIQPGDPFTARIGVRFEI